MPDIFEVGIVLIVIILFSIFAYRKKSLDGEGAIIASIVGVLVYWLGGINSFVAILTFFIIADFFTKYGRQKKGKQHEKRTTGNILGNSGTAIISLLLGSPIGYFGALSAALADTLSSEIGMLSREKTVLITNPKKKVSPGTDGGVTLLGLEASVLGAVLMAIVYYFFFGNWMGAGILIAVGFFGSFVDSLLGALFERRGILNNMEVNFFGSGAGALAAHLLFGLL